MEKIIQFIPDDILSIFQNDYPFIKELIEYKRDGTLLLLKSQRAVAFYEGKLYLNVKRNVKDWQEFIGFSRNYIRYFVQNGLHKYQLEEKYIDDNKKKYSLLEMGFFEPVLEKIINAINKEYLKKFPGWPTSGTQEDCIELNLNNFQEVDTLRIYWSYKGTIFIQDTKYDSIKEGYNYKKHFLGKPEFQLSYFDFEKISQWNEMAKKNMNQIKGIIDKLEEKYLSEKMNKLIINFDIN